VSRATMLAMAYKLIKSAQERWNKFAGFERLAQVITGIKFVDGVSEVELKDSAEAKAA
jgi:putative transposase